MVLFILEIFSFLLFVFAFLHLTGKLFIAKLKLKLDILEYIFFSIGIGLMIFTLIAYILSWIKLDILILPVILLIAYFAIRQKMTLGKFDKKHLWPLFLVSVFILIFTLNMWITGQFGDSIIYRHDDPWHLALINEMKINFPPDNPGFAEIPLRGYHFFYDFLMAKVSNIFIISPLSLYFRFFPLLVSFLWGIGVYVLMYKWSKKISTSLWAVFLTMFGGSFAFVLGLLGHTGFNLNNELGIQQPFGLLYNGPFAISIAIILLVLFTMHQYLQTKNSNWLIPLSLCVGLVSMFKVYAGIVALGMFLLLIAFDVLIRRRLTTLPAIFAVGTLFFATFWVFAGGTGYLIWFPLWAPHGVLTKFPWYKFEDKMYNYKLLNVTSELIRVELEGLFLFIAGNLGTRIIGLILLPLLLFKKIRKPSIFVLIVLSGAIASLLLPLFFIQSGKVFEIIQMGFYFLFFSGLLAAWGISAFFDLRFNILIKAALFLLLVLATLPSVYDELLESKIIINSSQSLSNPYFKGVKFLSEQGDYNSTVLELPPKTIQANFEEVKSWYYSSSPLINAFGNKRSYLNNEFIEFSGRDIAPRIELLIKLIDFSRSSKSTLSYHSESQVILENLRENNIHYIYSYYDSDAINHSGIKRIYRNESQAIYEIPYWR